MICNTVFPSEDVSLSGQHRLKQTSFNLPMRSTKLDLPIRCFIAGAFGVVGRKPAPEQTPERPPPLFSANNLSSGAYISIRAPLSAAVWVECE